MFGKNIKQIRESKNIGVNELSRISGISAGYISALERDEKRNPSVNTLERLAQALGVTIDDIMKTDLTNYDIEKFDKKSALLREETALFETGEFSTAEAAMQFILRQPAIMGYGGFDIEKLTEQEIIEFANDLLNQLQLVSLRYKK